MLIASLSRLPRQLTGPISRSIGTTSARMVRKMIVEEKDDTIFVKGIQIESDRTAHLIQVPEKKSQACPLCRLNLKSLKYTDVLILGQFIDSRGKLMSRAETQLCHRKYALVRNLVHKAQVCRMLPRPPDFPGSEHAWDKFNTYYDFPPRKRDQPFAKWVQEKYWK